MRNYVDLRCCHNQEKQKNNSLHSSAAVCQCLLWGSDFFLLEAFFGAEVFGSVTCIEQQGDKKYQNKYKGEGADLLEALRFLLCKLVLIYYLQVLDFNVSKQTL